MDIEDFDELEKTKDYSLKEVAKLLKVSSNDFIKYLLDNKYIYKSGTVKKNIAYKEYTTKDGSGLFYLKYDVNRFNGHRNIQTKITSKGLKHFKEIFENMHGEQQKLY